MLNQGWIQDGQRRLMRLFFLFVLRVVCVFALTAAFFTPQIYTGGAELTTATYNNACPAGKANAAIPSPAYKKRVIVEQDAYAFVGGKVCPVGEMACSVWRKGWSCLDVSENLS